MIARLIFIFRCMPNRSLKNQKRMFELRESVVDITVAARGSSICYITKDR